jgi:hypothetical protein
MVKQAPHCGHHQIGFTATEHQLRRLLKASHYGHSHVAVGLGDGETIQYRISIPGGRFEVLLDYLEADPIRQMYVELVYMSIEDRKKLLNQYCRNCAKEIYSTDWSGKNYCDQCSPDPKD